MIASIRGEVLDVALDHVVIEACGVGYRVNATPSTLATLRRGAETLLITAMIVREDSMTLYGFADSDARDLFLTLLGVSGVGPKIALATLAVFEAPASSVTRSLTVWAPGVAKVAWAWAPVPSSKEPSASRSQA
jgi:Holliday junction DNA helicase RuvA